jgi:Tol biopolymer transport system component/subtilase family serine protease
MRKSVGLLLVILSVGLAQSFTPNGFLSFFESGYFHKKEDREKGQKPKQGGTQNKKRQTSAFTNSTGIIAFDRVYSTDIWALRDVGGANNVSPISPSSQKPVFSPNGKKILFRSFRDGDPGNSGEIYSMNPDGYDHARLTNNSDSDNDFLYSADSAQIVFISNFNVWKMNSDGTNQMMLADFAEAIESPSFSPDGTKIVFYSNGIWLMDSNGSNQIEVSSNGENPKFTPDGLKIIFNRDNDISTINLDGANETELIDGDIFNYFLQKPVFSPSGSKILMECDDLNTSNTDVCVANADGTGFQSFGASNTTESSPVWSPDSLKIAYVSVNQSNLYQIIVASVGGGSPGVVYTESPNETLENLSWQYVCADAPINPNGLVSWWRGENNANDFFGTNNGSFLNGESYTNGRIGQAFSFNGSGNFVEIPDNNSLDVQMGDFTLAAWVKINSSREHFIAGKGACGSQSSRFYMGVDNMNDPFLDISHSTGGTRIGTSGNTLTVGQWHHLVMWKQGQDFKFFKDGNFVLQTNQPFTFEANDAVFTIGKGNSCAPPQLTTDGAIDEVHLYNRALSDAEITTLYNGNNPPCPPLTEPSVSVRVQFPIPVAGGRTAQGEVKLAQAAPVGGTMVNLVSSDTNVMTVPLSVTVPEGFVQANFTINSTVGSAFRSADVTATLGTETARTTVSVAPSAPDLAVSNLTAPPSVNILEDFTASWTITNNGEAATANFRQDTVYISPDNQLFNGNDTTIANGGDSVVINPTQSITSSVNNANIPSAAIPVDGTYYLFVYVGAAGTVNERNGNGQDNYVSIPIQVNRNLPDIVAENIVVPAEVEPNTLFTISWNLRNAGSRSTLAGFTHEVFLSFDQTVGNADDIPVTMRVSPALAVNETGSYSQQFIIQTLPVRPSSDALVYVKVDTFNQIFEGDPGSIPETNNTTTQAVRFEYRVPDLQVQSVTPPAEVDSDTPFALNWTTVNAGNKTAGAMNERVYFSTDNQVNGNDVEIGSFPLSQNLNPNQTVNRIQNVTIPTNSVPATGDYYVYVKTDADSQIDEGANENNNITFQPIRVRRLLRPDLQVTNITAPATAFFDQQIQVQWTINNAGQGPTNSPNWTDELLLGVNQTLNGANRLTALSNISYLNAGESYIATATVRIPRGSNGSYYLIVKTDMDNTVNEESENNNLMSRPITINVPPLPDLRVSNVQAPTEGFAGQPIAVSWTVTNNGDGATPANEATWTDAIYLSTDTNFDGGDRLIGTRQRTGTLAVNGNYTVSNYSVNLPGDVFGNYYVFVQTDYASQVYEFTAENNNTDYDRIQPGSPMNVLGTPPDLTVLSPITAPANELAGNPITVQFTVRNQGAFDATGTWREAVYISTDQTLDVNNDTFLGSVARNGLPAGQQYGASLDVTIPNCLQGTYYLFAVTDSNNDIFEFDANGNAETNNVSQPKAIALQSFAPDLRVTNMTVPPIVINGSMLMSWTVKNFGTAATTQTAWHDYVFINTGTQIINLGTFEHQGALAINGEYTQNRVAQIPLYLEGSFQIFVRTDAYNVVPECAFNQNNDDYRVADIQQDLPDLRISGVNSTGTAMLGESFNVSWTGGNFAAPMTQTLSWTDTVYLSSDATLNLGDIPIGMTILTNNLGTNQTYNGQAQVTIPNIAVGNYFLIVNADNGNNVQEGVDENNNASIAVPITLTAPQVDLQVSNVTANATLFAGQFADVSWTITNFGSSPTVSSSWTDYVILSRDSVFDSTDRILLYQQHNGVLNGGANYSETRSVQIPSGLTGDYYILVFTDRNNQVVENNETNNLSNPLAVNLQLPPPAELNITNITPPASVTLGDPSVFTWAVQNSSANMVNGIWQDSIYLSTDTIWDSGDMLIGQKQRSGTLAAFATYTETLNSPIPPIETGTYYVIVRTDARNTVRESDESNNVSTSTAQTIVSVPNLTLGTPVNTTLITGQERFYSIFNTPLDETMLVTLTGQNGSSNELYTRSGSMVSRANYEFQGSRQGEANQENIVPNTTVGTYYTMARGDYVPGTFAENLKKTDEAKTQATTETEAVTIKAELLPFGIRTVSPGEAGNKGYTMISVEGAKFQNGASIKLTGPNNTVRHPRQRRWLDE